jgi:hypothetical protein
MPMKLSSGQAELQKIDTKRRGGETGKIIALHLHFKGLVNKSSLKALLNTETPPELWEEGGRKHPLWPSMGKFPSLCEFNGGKVSFAGTVELTDCKITNISMLPQEGGTLMTSLVVKCHPTKPQIGQISDLLGEVGKLVISANLLLDPDPDPDEEGGDGDDQRDLLGKSEEEEDA